MHGRKHIKLGCCEFHSSCTITFKMVTTHITPSYEANIIIIYTYFVIGMRTLLGDNDTARTETQATGAPASLAFLYQQF